MVSSLATRIENLCVQKTKEREILRRFAPQNDTLREFFSKMLEHFQIMPDQITAEVTLGLFEHST